MPACPVAVMQHPLAGILGQVERQRSVGSQHAEEADEKFRAGILGPLLEGPRVDGAKASDGF